MTDNFTNQSTWWGQFELALGKSLQWQIGPLTLLVQHLPGEWQIFHNSEEENEDNAISWNMNETDQSPDDLNKTSRYIFRREAQQIEIKPALADRPVISRPRSPFNLPAGEEVTLYVSTPLWIEICAGESPKKLEEIAIQRPSDTWFGPSTREGELCYASRTSCRHNLEEIPLRPHRAITPVHIKNRADTTLLIERLSLPVPMLPLFANKDGVLWTPKVTLIRDRDGDMAALRIDDNAPQEASNACLINPPRKTAGVGTLVRAFGSLFS